MISRIPNSSLVNMNSVYVLSENDKVGIIYARKEFCLFWALGPKQNVRHNLYEKKRTRKDFVCNNWLKVNILIMKTILARKGAIFFN